MCHPHHVPPTARHATPRPLSPYMPCFALLCHPPSHNHVLHNALHASTLYFALHSSAPRKQTHQASSKSSNSRHMSARRGSPCTAIPPRCSLWSGWPPPPPAFLPSPLPPPRWARRAGLPCRQGRHGSAAEDPVTTQAKPGQITGQGRHRARHTV